MKRFLLASLLIGTWLGTPVRAADTPESLEKITNEILREEIDLERFYLKYQISGSKEPRFRYPRYFMLQNAGTACSLSSNIINVKLTGSNLYTPDRISRRTSRKALTAGMMGILLDGSSSGIELTSNGLLAIANKNRHNDPKWAVNSVIERLRSIDNLMEQRKVLVGQIVDPQAQAIATSEAQVLKTFRDWCAYEFSNIYADIKSYQASSNIYYMMNIASNGCYLGSYVLNYKLFNHPNLGGKASISGIVGDALGVTDVPASAVGYNIFYKYWHNRLARKLNQKLDDSESDAKAAMEKLTSAVTTSDNAAITRNGSVRERMSIYSVWSKHYDSFINDQMVELRHENRVALQGDITGPAISATYLSADIMNALSFYSTKKDHGRAVDSLGFGGAVSSLVGTSSSLALTNLLFVNDYLHRKKLRKQHLLPEQLLDDRFKTLDELDGRLAKAGAAPM